MSITAEYKSRAQYEKAQRNAILKSGSVAYKAIYNKSGDCLICGEAGRCPGWHTSKEQSKLK
jgi:hypothetical protein